MMMNRALERAEPLRTVKTVRSVEELKPLTEREQLLHDLSNCSHVIATFATFAQPDANDIQLVSDLSEIRAQAERVVEICVQMKKLGWPVPPDGLPGIDKPVEMPKK